MFVKDEGGFWGCVVGDCLMISQVYSIMDKQVVMRNKGQVLKDVFVDGFETFKIFYYVEFKVTV